MKAYIILSLLVLVLVACTNQKADAKPLPACVREGGTLGAVIPGNTKECCPGLEAYIPSGIVGIRGTCLRPETIPKDIMPQVENVDGIPVGELANQEGEIIIYGKATRYADHIEVTSGDKTVIVMYQNMITGPEEHWPDVTIEGFQEGDLVVVRGELRDSETFWARSIKRVELKQEPIEYKALNESIEIAREFIKKSPTYRFDGSELEYQGYEPLDCIACYEFTFTSSQAGYGDRTDQILAQVITQHTAVLTIQNGDIMQAILDDEWDMIKQKPTS